MKKKSTTVAATQIGTQIVRLPAVRARVGLSTPSIYRLVRAGLFPRPIKLGTFAVGWLEHEVEAWLTARVAERDVAHEGLTSP